MEQYEYSLKELELITYFGYDKLCNECSPYVLYRQMAEKAFADDMAGAEVESLRRCLNALRATPQSYTPDEWDAMITFSD